MAVNGWRLWRVDPDGTLRSVWKASHKPWTAQPQHAACARVTLLWPPAVQSRAHRAPGPDCDCGYYLMLTAEQLAELWVPSPVVAGTAVAWGTVVPHAFGYRAERCQITALLDGPLPGSTHGRWASADMVQLAATRHHLPVLPADLANEGRLDHEQGSHRP